METNVCPECGKLLTPRMKRCSCGWYVLEQTPVDDHGCQYRLGGRRCPLPGTVSSSRYGRGTWYCADHCRSLGDPKSSAALLDHIEKNQQKILEDRCDWRKKLFKKCW